MPELRARSALARFAAAGELAALDVDGLALRELPPTAIVRVQLLEDAPAPRAALEAAIAQSLPGPGRLAGDAGRRCAWVAPLEWLLFLAPAAEPALLEALAAAGKGVFATSIGDARVGIAVTGARAAELLARGTGLDLHASSFVPGRSANTRLAQLAVMIARPGDAPAFEVWVDRSSSAWLWQWLLDAATEFAPAH